MSSVNLEVACAYLKTSPPLSLASFIFFSASAFTFCLSSIVFLLNSGGWPSKTKAGFIPASTKLAVLYNNPERWLVTIPFLSFNGSPVSLSLIIDKNWKIVLNASIAILLPERNLRSISFPCTNLDKLTPIKEYFKFKDKLLDL